HRAAVMAGCAVPADRVGAGAAAPRRAAGLRRIVRRVLAVAADLLRGGVVGVRRRLHGLRTAGAADLAVGTTATFAPRGCAATSGLILDHGRPAAKALGPSSIVLLGLVH